jgi:hypothetical protein
MTKLASSQLNLIARTGIHPTRWLLEKLPGVALVDKLQAILLMEGDFNFFNKWLFGRIAVGKLYEMATFQKTNTAKRTVQRKTQS